MNNGRSIERPFCVSSSPTNSTTFPLQKPYHAIRHGDPASVRANPKEVHMAIRHLSQIELAARWNISHRTLERWRWTGEGPKFIKLGGRVIYRLEDVEAFEVEQIRGSDHEPHRPMSA